MLNPHCLLCLVLDYFPLVRKIGWLWKISPQTILSPDKDDILQEFLQQYIIISEIPIHSLVVASLVFIYFFTKQRFILFLILFQFVWIKSTLQGRRLLLFFVLLSEMCDNLFDTFPHLNALDFCILRIICKWVIHKLPRRVCCCCLLI